MNTFKEKSQMVEAIEQIGILLEDTYTVNMEMDVEGEVLEVQYVTQKGDKQAFGKVDMDEIPELEFLVGITSSEVKAQVPNFFDYVFTYDYKNPKKGYITEEIDEEIIDAVDEACKLIYSPDTQSDFVDKISKDILKELKDLEFETVDKKKYDINGKKRDCGGYKVELTDKFFVNIFDIVKEYIDSEYGDQIDELDVYGSVDEAFEEIRDELKYIEDMEITFYLYKNKVACLAIEMYDEVLEIMIKDCEKGMYDIEVCLEDDTILEIDGSVKDSVEKYEVEMEYGSPISVTYNTKSGDYEVESSYLCVEGNMKKTSKGVSFSIEELEQYGYSYDMAINFLVEKDAKMKKFSGKEFDIGNASEDDFEEIEEEIYSVLYNF